VDLEALVKHPDILDMAAGMIMEENVEEGSGNDSDAFFALSPSQGAM
jgi:hypothetical protein